MRSSGERCRLVHVTMAITSTSRKPFRVADLPVAESNICDVPRDGSLVRLMASTGKPSFAMHYDPRQNAFVSMNGLVTWFVDMPDSGATHWRMERVN